MADIGKLTPVTGTPWPHRHIPSPGESPRKDKRHQREPQRSRKPDDDEPNHIDEYA